MAAAVADPAAAVAADPAAADSEAVAAEEAPDLAAAWAAVAAVQRWAAVPGSTSHCHTRKR